MMDTLARRLLALGQMGAYLVGMDGHIWIEQDENFDNEGLAGILRDGGVALNNKIYGGVLEALDTIDEALRRAKYVYPTLLQNYDEDILFLGETGIGQNRIEVGSPGDGGIF
ncbi:MAG: hypothetical protein V1899_02810 [Planctomycetota bacterium]